MTAQSVSAAGKSKARRAANSSAMEYAARWGLAARGVIYLLIGVIALRVAFGDSGGKEADRSGALEEIATKPGGSVMLWVLAVGLVGMALWRLSEAAFGQAGPDGQKASKRLVSGFRAVFYGFVAFSVISFAAGTKGNKSGDQESKDITAKIVDLPAGQFLLGVGGLTIAIIGVVIAVRAIKRSYHKHLKLGEMSQRARKITDFTGVTGGIARGVLFAAIGVFALVAAVKYEPDDVKGIDDTLRTFTETPAGPWLLVAVAVGLMLFGVFSFAMARWRKV
ncbi:DUF1206 domain-containing protein [Streptomyces sp. NPDC060194]|uniref:DUF1206 domain-containing protein n=1 Tax=Streptomyces sp. NPDC060194 TaxID=3347069 RepID=UPI0036643776